MKDFELYFYYGLYYEQYMSDEYLGTELYGKEKGKVTSFKEFGKEVLINDVLALEKDETELLERIPYQWTSIHLSMEEKNILYNYLHDDVGIFSEKIDEMEYKNKVSNILFYVYRDVSRLVRAYRTCFEEQLDYGEERIKRILFGYNGEKFFFDDAGIEQYIEMFSDRYENTDIKYIISSLVGNLKRLLLEVNTLLLESDIKNVLTLKIISISINIYNKYM